MLRVKSDQSDCFWSQSIVFYKPIQNLKPECRWTWPEVHSGQMSAHAKAIERAWEWVAPFP